MNKKILFSEKKVLKNLKFLVEQDESMYKISPEEFNELVKFASGNVKAITKLPKFQGKKLWITGDLKINGSDVNSLGNIGYVEGRLDIGGTNISDLGDVVVKGYISDYGTPRQKKREAIELAKKRSENEDREEEGEWDINNPNIDSLGIKANILYRYLIENGDVNEPSEDEKEEIVQIESELEDLNKKYNQSEEPEEYNEISDKISELEERLEELKPQITVYDLFPTRYTHYGLTQFEVLSPDFRNQEYTVGTESEMDDAAKEYADNYFDEIGIEGFNSSFLEDHIDNDYLESYVKDFYESDVYDNPDVYFNDDDYELSSEQEERKDQLEEYISKMEDRKSELEDEQSELEDEQSEFEHNSDEYNNIDEKLQEINSNLEEIDDNIETAQNEIDEIEENKKEVTDDMVEKVVQDRIDDALYDPVSFIKDWGLDLKNFIDKDSLAQGLVDSDGWGIMNGYDGNYDSVNSVWDETYYVMRIN